MAPPPEEVPVTVDELADLQAGLLAPEQAARLRDRVAHDPAAAELLGALELVDAELAALPDDPVPDDVVARLDRAIAAEPLPEAAGDAEAGTRGEAGDAGTGGDAGTAAPPPVDLAARRRRRLVTGIGGLVVAAAVAGVVAGVLPSGAAPPVAGSVPSYGATDLAAAWPDVAGLRDPGPLGDPTTLRSCLTAGGIAPAGEPELLGARPVVVDGRSGVLVALAAPPDAGGARVLLAAFDPGCGPDALLARTTVPG